jgi:deoxycytidylate deaminase
VKSNILTYAPKGSGPCAKQTVKATIITQNGTRFVGTNHCLAPQTTCARAGMPTGVGYDLCKSVCRQEGHAETNALRIAGANAAGSTLYVEGHTYACDSCKAAALEAGVTEIVIGAPPEAA